MLLPSSCYKSVISFILAASVFTADASIKPAAAVKMLCPAVKKAKSAEEKRQATLYKRLLEIAKGGNIDAVDKNGQTALMCAAELNNRLAVCWLVAKGADVLRQTAKKKLARDYATDRVIRDLLDACASLQKKTEKWDESKVRELYGEDSRRLRYDIFSSKDRKLGAKLRGMHEGKLIVQCDIGPDVYAFLIRTGYDVNAKGENGETALNIKTPADLAQLMLALGVNLNAENPEQMLCFALHRDDTDGVVEALKKKPEMLEEADQIIAATKSAEMVRVLIGEGLDVKELRQQNGRAISLLESAIRGGGRVEVVKELLAAECPLPTGEPSLLTLMAQHCPSAGDTAKLLIDAGLSVSDDDLREAVDAVSLPLVKLALEKGANAKQIDANGYDLLRRLCEYYDYSPHHKDFGTIGKLLADAGMNVTDDDLRAAVKARSLPLVKLALERGANAKQIDENGNNLLHYLYGSQGSPLHIGAIAKLLIKAGADLNHTREFRSIMHGTFAHFCEKATPLHFAVIGGGIGYELNTGHYFYMPQYAAERELKVECIGELINMMDKLPEDILQFVGSVELTPQQCGDIALMLLDKGASIKGEGEKSPLVSAGAYDARVTKRLLAAGLGKNKDELTAALRNARTAEVVDVLLAAGADKNVIGDHVIEGEPGCIYPVVKRLLEAGAATEWVNRNGDKAYALNWLGVPRMHRSALRDEDYINVAQELGKAGAKIDLFEAGDGYYNSSAPLLKIVLKFVTDINAQNDAGNTVMMHWLIKHGFWGDSLKVLLQAGARTDIRNKEGKTVLKIALEKKEEICKDPSKMSDRELKNLEKTILLLKAMGAKE